jgi:hypothetical protein
MWLRKLSGPSAAGRNGSAMVDSHHEASARHDGAMRPRPGELLHFSEDPTITRFEPHVAATAQEEGAFVWAVDEHHAPSYWFPRQCPRAMAWCKPETTDEDRDRIIGVGCGDRVHAIEFQWLPRVQATTLYAYRLPVDGFDTRFGSHAWVSTEPVEPVGAPEAVGDLLARHEDAGIQLRVLNNLWAWWDAVINSTVNFSGIRLHNAAPRPHETPSPI